MRTLVSQFDKRAHKVYNSVMSKRNTWLLYKYGITESDFNVMLEEQGSICPLCKRDRSEFKQMVVDHCHESGKVRGIICRGCNASLAKLGDSVDSVKRAIEYLS